ALGSLSVPVFLAETAHESPIRMTLHVGEPPKRAKLGREAEAALSRAGIAAECRVRPIKYRRVARARTLQDVLRPFGRGTIVYDPTESITRATALMRCADRLRAALGPVLRAIHLEPHSRTLFLLCKPEQDRVGEPARLDGAARRRIESAASAVLENWQGDAGAFSLSVRLCEKLPKIKLLAVDRASLPGGGARGPWRAALHSGMVIGGLASLFGLGMSRPALADGPAVSELNAKAALEGGVFDRKSIGFATGSVTTPVGHDFGLQVDGGVGAQNGRAAYGLAGQGFWRDPDIGLAGVFASTFHRKFQDVNVRRYGAEGELYLGQFTVDGRAGAQLSHDVHSGGFVHVDLSWYAIDNLKVTGGVDYSPAKVIGLAGGEYQLGVAALPGLTAFAQIGAGHSGLDHAIAGFRYYFGPNKTLIRRQREDDPLSLTDLWDYLSTAPKL
ncbi:MAG: hypothetical protein ACREDI_13690, partial [Roseiarcus sp.]